MAIKIFLGKPPIHIENWIKNNFENTDDSKDYILVTNNTFTTLNVVNAAGIYNEYIEGNTSKRIATHDIYYIEGYIAKIKKTNDMSTEIYVSKDSPLLLDTEDIIIESVEIDGDYGCGCGGSGCGDYGCGDYGCGCGGSGCGESYQIQINNQTNFVFETSQLNCVSLYIPANGTAYAVANDGFTLELPVSHINDINPSMTLQIYKFYKNDDSDEPQYYNVCDYDTIPIQITGPCSITISEQ